ncbi:MAG: dual specificity protein phosphatase [Chloroflexota bacterium]
MFKITPWLYIGKYRETRNKHLLDSYKITAMLQMANPVTYPDITSLYLPVEDGVPLSASLLRQGVDFVVTEKEQGRTILIACGAGISRSSTFATAALKELDSSDLLTALQTVRDHHPQALPHPALWKSLCRYYNEDIAFNDIFIRSTRSNLE